MEDGSVAWSIIIHISETVLEAHFVHIYYEQLVAPPESPKRRATLDLFRIYTPEY